MRFRLVVDGEPHEIEVVRRRDRLVVSVDGAEYPAKSRVTGEEIEVRIRGSRHRVRIQGDRIHVDGHDHAVIAEPVDEEPEPAGGTDAERVAGILEVRPPMPGRVVRVLVSKGQRVRRGQPVAILEAMKMQNEIPAPADGVVREVNAAEGESIPGDRVIVRLEATRATAS